MQKANKGLTEKSDLSSRKKIRTSDKYPDWLVVEKIWIFYLIQNSARQYFLTNIWYFITNMYR